MTTPMMTSHSQQPMPAIMYGTAWKKDRTAEHVFTALKQGFRGVDTACQPKHYSEAGVGEGIEKAMKELAIPRRDLFIQTKFTGLQGQDPNRVPYNPDSKVSDQVSESIFVSLKNLKVDELNSLVLHGPLQTWDLTLEAWHALERALEKGYTRQIGISNCYEPDLLLSLIKNSTVKPAVLQNRFYQDTQYDSELRKICDDHKIIYQCFWTLTANPHILENDTVKNIATNKGKTEAQIFFRFVHQLGIQILTGTTSPTHMKEDLQIFNFQLNQEEFKKIHALLNP